MILLRRLNLLEGSVALGEVMEVERAQCYQRLSSVSRFGLWVSGFGFRVSGFNFRVLTASTRPGLRVSG